MFDTKTEKFQEWEIPTPYSAPRGSHQFDHYRPDQRGAARASRGFAG